MEFNFGAHSLIFACYAPGLCGFRGIFFVRQSLKKPPAMQVDNNRFSLQ